MHSRKVRIKFLNTKQVDLYEFKATNRLNLIDYFVHTTRNGITSATPFRIPFMVTEKGGFEPPMKETSILDFESSAFNRSATSP